MIFLDGTSSSVLLILAVLPAAVVMFYVWKMDKREKEPVKLLLQLFGLGADGEKRILTSGSYGM